MKLVVLITARAEMGLEVAEAWQVTGAPGVTILRSHGLHALQQKARHGSVELPRMMASMASAMAGIIQDAEQQSELILSLCDEALVDSLIDAATSVLGDLTEPGHGVLFVIDVERALGVVTRHSPGLH